MRIPFEEKRAEAIARLEKLGICAAVVEGFRQGDMAVSIPPKGACIWLGDDGLERVRRLEERHDVLVYHVVRTYTNVGELESHLFVSGYREDWPLERGLIENGRAYAYVWNLDDPTCSDMGVIGVRPMFAGGLLRVM